MRARMANVRWHSGICDQDFKTNYVRSYCYEVGDVSMADYLLHQYSLSTVALLLNEENVDGPHLPLFHTLPHDVWIAV